MNTRLKMTKNEDSFDEFVDQLQQEIIQEELKEYNEYIVNLFHNPQNWGKPKDFTIEESYKGSCGDTMQFFLKINNGIVEDVHFLTDGCGASVATGSQTSLMAKGKPIEEVEKLTAKEIDEALHGLPADHKHCAALAATTLKKAIKKYKNKT